MKKLTYIAILLALVIVPAVALAQSIVPPDVFGLPGDKSSTITGEISLYIRYFLTIVGLIAVVYLIYGGFRYIMSAGDSEAAEGAKNTIVNAIIGLVVIILSYVIVVVITRALLGNT